jgi:uncharacterized protein with FMN-binding domain
MKKSIVVILAVALIGVLGLHKDNDKGVGSLVSASSHGMAMPSGAPHHAMSSYKDGTYSGAAQDTPYGTVQIAVVVSGGKITNVNFLQMPSDLGHSQEVTSASEPLLKQTTLQKQSAHIDFVSGATTTSEAYQISLQAALDQAV